MNIRDISIFHDNKKYLSRVDWVSDNIWCVFYPYKGDVETDNFFNMSITVVNFNKNVEWFTI